MTLLIAKADGGSTYQIYQDFYELLEFLGPRFNIEWCGADDEKGMEDSQRYGSNEAFIRNTMVFSYQSIGLMYAGIHRPYIARILQVSTALSPVTLLDVGSGGGQMALAFHALGFIVSMADVLSNSMLFAEWRVRRRGLHLPVYVLDYHSVNFPDVPPQGIVTCFDVLEHMEFEEQKRLLDWMGSIGGLVFANLIVDDTHPGMHLPMDVDGLVTYVQKTWKVELSDHYPDADGKPRQHLLIYGRGVSYDASYS